MHADKYRLLIWRFLLLLPENTDAHRGLVVRGVPAACAHLPEKFPLGDRRVGKQLLAIVAALTHWYVPALCVCVCVTPP